MASKHYHVRVTVPTDDGHADTDRFHTDSFIRATQVLARYSEVLSIGIRRVRRCNDPESVNMERI